MKVLIFDVETTGLLPKNIKNEEIEKYPYIIQLSYILFEKDINKIVEKFDNYIILKRRIKIPKIVTDLTGITKENCLSGVTIHTVLSNIYNAMEKADVIVAHNIEFDSRMLMVELERNNIMLNATNPEVFNIVRNLEKKNYCTMMNGKLVCKIKALTKGGKEYIKWPKLIELYRKLFNGEVDNLHNSLVDALVCLRCYLKMSNNINIEDDDFTKLLEDV